MGPKTGKQITKDPSGNIGVDAGYTSEGTKSKALDERGITFLQAHWTLSRTCVKLSHIH